MNDKLLRDLRSKYMDKIVQQESNEKKLQVLLQRKAILENSPIVKGYVELLEQIDEVKNNTHDIKHILDNLVWDADNNYDQDTNKIYYYVGTFINDGKMAIPVDRNDSLGEFDSYVDIESLCTIDNPIEDRDSFEKSNTVIITDDELYELHDTFIMDCVRDGQDSAVTKVLTRYKKNR